MKVDAIVSAKSVSIAEAGSIAIEIARHDR